MIVLGNFYLTDQCWDEHLFRDMSCSMHFQESVDIARP